ncbi:hypothetical protein Rin_00004710 [Candidatus Regiella insecticola 5.15]|uniref:Uncharacterized protein n=1 Tax=Candidatus Regiella insecticola 5.15 TaxID=1005043 RepID=G2GXH9_9ENTR|nr:hypothetical protein Rin_00004710 [Candidatus Regiella insecticola 5.15]
MGAKTVQIVWQATTTQDQIKLLQPYNSTDHAVSFYRGMQEPVAVVPMTYSLFPYLKQPNSDFLISYGVSACGNEIYSAIEQ